MLIHTGPIAGIATHEKWVATAGYDNKVILWNAADKKPIAQGMHDHLVNNCSFSPDGKWLVSASSDYSSRLWSLHSMRLEAVLTGHRDDVDMAVFSPDSQLIATCALDRRVRVFDLSGHCLAEFAGHTGNVLALAWTADGQSIVSTSVDGTVRRWGFVSGQQEACSDLRVRTDSIAIARNGLIYAGDDKGRLAVIRGDAVVFHDAHQAGIKKVVLDERKAQLVCLSYDGFMSVWDIRGDQPKEISRSRLPHAVWARSAAVLDDGCIVSGTFGSTYAMYDPATEKWDMSGVQAGSAINAVHVVQEHVYTIGDAGELKKDGEPVANLGSLCNFLISWQGRLFTGGQLGKLFDALTGEVLFQHHSPLNCGVSYEHQGRSNLVIGTYTGELLVFDISKTDVHFLEELQVYENAVKGVTISEGRLFSVCANTDIAWHALETLSQHQYIRKAHEKIANDCCTIDDDHFATISRDKTLKIWNEKGHETFESPHSHSVKCMAINEDKSKLLTGSYGGTLAMFDLSQRTWTWFGRPTIAGISDITWHCQSQTFLAASYDGHVYPVRGA